MEIATAALAGQVGVVRRRHQAHGLCRAREHEADGVGQVLELVSLEANVVMDNVVMGGAGRALQSAMC